MKSHSCPVHPNFNSVAMRDMRERESARHRYDSLRAMRVHLIPNCAPSALAPVGGYSRALVGVIAGASGFLPCFTVERGNLATVTLDGMPVVRKSARKAWRSAQVIFSRVRMMNHDAAC